MYRPVIQCLLIAFYFVSPFVLSQALEQTVVTGQKPAGETGQHLRGYTSFLELETAISPPTTLSDLLSVQPGIAYTGQGGLLQTVSIRGLSGQRIGAYFLDIPLLTERRAGTSASFIDPSMLGTVELVRGAATTAHGSANLGGLIRSQPNQHNGSRAGLGWGGSGEENLQYVSMHSEQGSFALSHRGANDGKTSDGDPLHTQFEQYNIMLSGERDYSGANYQLVSLASYGKNIGKSNALFPDARVTHYPRERHWLTQLTRTTKAENRTAVYFHYQELDTDVLRPGDRFNQVQGNSFDFGARFSSRQWMPGDTSWGVEYLGRRNVDAQEREVDLSAGTTFDQQLLSAEQDELAVFTQGHWQQQRWDYTAGVRLSAIAQNADGWESESDFFATGFLGVSFAAATNLDLTAELSRGARAANLSEKYFSGTTGRGAVRGNPGLSAESTKNFALGAIYQISHLRIDLHAYHTDLHDFIERVDVMPFLTTQENLGGGRIRGLDFSVHWQPEPRLTVTFAGHYQDGENDDGGNLQDIAANKILLATRYAFDVVWFSVDYQHRFAKRDVSTSELALDQANLLGFSVGWQTNPQLEISIWGRNLLDDTYRITADDLSTNAEERAFGLRLRWQR